MQENKASNYGFNYLNQNILFKFFMNNSSSLNKQQQKNLVNSLKALLNFSCVSPQFHLIAVVCAIAWVPIKSTAKYFSCKHPENAQDSCVYPSCLAHDSPASHCLLLRAPSFSLSGCFNGETLLMAAGCAGAPAHELWARRCRIGCPWQELLTSSGFLLAKGHTAFWAEIKDRVSLMSYFSCFRKTEANNITALRTPLKNCQPFSAELAAARNLLWNPPSSRYGQEQPLLRLLQPHAGTYWPFTSDMGCTGKWGCWASGLRCCHRPPSVSFHTWFSRGSIRSTEFTRNTHWNNMHKLWHCIKYLKSALGEFYQEKKKKEKIKKKQ